MDRLEIVLVLIEDWEHGESPRRPSGYQPGALLLSYETMVNCGFAPNRFTGRNTRFSLRIGRIRRTRVGL